MAESPCLNAPVLPEMDGEPPFAAPWQARAFALTVALHKAGLFAWREWAEILSQQIAAADHQHDGHTPSYYECWLAALERILVEKNLASPEILRKTADETLRDWPRPDHTPRREPVTVARAHAGDK